MAKIATAFIFVALVALAASQGFGSPSQPPPQQPPVPANNPSPLAPAASGSELPPSTPSTLPTTTVGTLVPASHPAANSTSPLAEKHVGEEHGKNGASTNVAVVSGILLVLTAPLLM